MNDDFVGEMRTAWIYGKHVSTLPTWTRPQEEVVEEAKEALPTIDADRRRSIVHRLVLVLGCKDCEKRETDECNFHVCVAGLLSGVSEKG